MQFLKRLSDPIFWLSLLFHLVLLVTPFVFTWVNEELFEFPKMLFVYLLSILILAVWIWRMVQQRKILLAQTPLDIPLLFFLFSQVIATLFSIHTRTSIFGYYTRFNGGLLSTLAYVVLFYAFASNFQKKHLPHFFKTLFLSVALSSLYAIPEHFGHSPSCLIIAGQFDVACWVQDVQTRVFASFGQPNWLAAFLIATIPLTLSGITTQIKQKWLWIVMALATLALLFTKSRSGVLGLGVGLSVLVVAQSIFIRNHIKQLLLSLGIIGLIAVILGTPFSPSISSLWQSTSPIPVSQPSGTVLDTGGTESGEIRKIVWEGAIRVWQRYPLFGSGVETFAYSYYQDRPVEHNNVSEWDFLYNKAHNEFLNYLATTGAVGAFSYVLLLVWFGLVCLVLAQNQRLELYHRQLAVALLSGAVALSVSNFFGFSTVMVNVLLFWYMAVVSILNTAPTFEVKTINNRLPSNPVSLGQWLLLSFTMIMTLVLLYQVYQQWWADRLFVRAKSLFSAGQYELALDHFAAAIAASPTEALFYDELAMNYGKLAVELEKAGETTSAAQLSETAIKASDYALELNPRHLNFYKTRARIFINLAQIKPAYLNEAEKTLKTAIELSPTDAKLYYNLALIKLANDDRADGMTWLQKAIELKPNYLTARYELGKQWEAEGKPDLAKAEYELILTQLSPDNPEVTARLNAIASSSGTIRP